MSDTQKEGVFGRVNDPETSDTLREIQMRKKYGLRKTGRNLLAGRRTKKARRGKKTTRRRRSTRRS